MAAWPYMCMFLLSRQTQISWSYTIISPFFSYIHSSLQLTITHFFGAWIHLYLQSYVVMVQPEQNQAKSIRWVQPQQNQENTLIHIFIGLIPSLNPLQSSTKPGWTQLPTSQRLRHCRGNCLFHFHPQRAAPNWCWQRHCAGKDWEFIMADGDSLVIWWELINGV